MPCYTAWNECIELETLECVRAETEVRAKMLPVKHVVDRKVSSEATSKIALDRPGAAVQLGRGHLAAKLNGEQGLLCAQAPFLSDKITAAMTAISRDNSPRAEHGPA